VVDVRESEPRVLRPGALSIPALRAVVPSLQYARIESKENVSRTSPGQDARHYAPRTPLVLAPDRATALERASKTKNACVILFGEGPTDPTIRVLPGTPEAAGAALFALLHELDRDKWAILFVEPPPDAPGWEAIADRLQRASIASTNTLGV